MGKIALVVVLGVHGLIHLLGFVKGMGLAPVEQLKEPITKAQGALWLGAAVLFLVAALLLVLAPRAWWMAALPAVVLSQVLIVSWWSDAKFGTIANVIVLVPLALALAALRPSSLPSEYRRAVAAEEETARARPAPRVIEAQDLAALPPLVRTWLEKAGVVGRPRVRGVRAQMTGALRNGADAPWMKATFEQHNTFSPASRVFFMEARRAGVPFVALHTYRGPSAIMRVQILGLFQIIDAKGPEMDKSETVTMLNDLVVLAPAAVVDAPITWETIDATRVKATFTNAGHTVSAVLTFADGDLVGFVSNDRLQSADGKTYRALPWSTPLTAHAVVNGVRLPREASAVWLDPAGDLAYARFTVDDVTTY